MLNFKKDFEKDLFEQAMKDYADSYDPAVRMSTSYRGLHGYHSRLSDCTVHEIRKSFEYAYNLLEHDAEGDRERAWDILYRVLPLQDVNPARDTYGIWQYFLEEDLEEMNPPDWNWADFNGKLILQMLREHSDALTDDLKARMKDAVYHACRSIIRRNVQPHYTNISVMGSYVTLVAGEFFGWKDIFDYGKQRLTNLYRYNVDHGSFSEFNSPCYTFVVLFDLTRLYTEVQDADCARMAKELCRMAWETVAIHFHVPTGQMAGPHDRAYSFLLDDGTKLSVERALDYRIRLAREYPAHEFSDRMQCPEEFIPYFTTPAERVLDNTFAPGRMAYTYMNDTFTLGSLHREVAWNQHRNVLGYFGTVEEPVALNLKCLHDGYDYCSGMMVTVQEKERTLTTVGFTTNRGDTHINLDPVKDATISADDLRVRWLFGGAVKHLDVETLANNTFRVTDRRSGLHVVIAFPFAVMSGQKVTFEVNRTEDELAIDAVLYHGERRDICFTDLSEIAVATALCITFDDVTALPVTAAAENDLLTAEYDGLKVQCGTRANKSDQYLKTVRLFRHGKPYEPAF